MSRAPNATWPKRVPQLTSHQRRIQEDWIQYWLEIGPQRRGWIERFNNGYAARTAFRGARTLEIGAGLGEHLHYEDHAAQEYYALELRDDLLRRIQREFPTVNTMLGDCQERLPFEDDFFDRVLAIHVLEHLPNLPAALAEVRRVLKPGGSFAVVIPCEGGLAYSLARRVTAQRTFERRYGVSYQWHIRSDHLSVPAEIVAELRKNFRVIDRTFSPLPLPSVNLNLLIGMTMAPLPKLKRHASAL